MRLSPVTVPDTLTGQGRQIILTLAVRRAALSEMQACAVWHGHKAQMRVPPPGGVGPANSLHTYQAHLDFTITKHIHSEENDTC
jgi:hypothetical protein